MLIYRLEDLSVKYFVEDIFRDVPFITIVDSFPDQILQVPTVSIEAGRLKEELFEIGNRDRVRIRRWYIDIFAKSIPQRDDMAYRLMDESKDGINIYDYNEGFPPSVSPTKIGHMDIMGIAYEPIPVFLEEHENKYYRGQVTLVSQNDTV